MARRTQFKLKLSDLVLLVYVAAVTREFLWVVSNQTAAWVLTALISFAILTVHALCREEFVGPDDHSGLFGKVTIIICALPLVIIFLLRLPFPDHNYDVLNYHLVYMERALRGWPLIPGDFFPAVVQFNPAADIATGICKYTLGFRLGHLINLGAVLWTASIAERFLRDAIQSYLLRRLAALVVVSTELILILQSIYLVDLLALPLLAEATLLAINFPSVRRKHYTLIHIGLLLGISLAFKLSNLAFIIPIGAVAIYQAYVCRKELGLPLPWVGMAAAFIAPAAPFFIFMFRATGNPVFPLLNSLFRSPLSPNILPDSGLGPASILQTLLWPFWVFLYPERGSEFLGGDNPYTGRITLAVIFAVVAVLTPQLDKQLRLLGLVAFVSIILWSASSGNLRYGIFAEVLGGILIIAVLAALYRTAGPAPRRKLAILVSSFAVLLAVQVLRSYQETLTLSRLSYGDKIQPTIFQDRRVYAEFGNIFRDRNAPRFLSSEERQTLAGIEVWVNSYPTTVGLMASLKPQIPILTVTLYQPTPGSYDPLSTDAARARFAMAQSAVTGKRLYSLVYEEHLKEALAYLNRVGLKPARIDAWQMPYYSMNEHLSMKLIELRKAEPNDARNVPAVPIIK
ncbi:MAG: hypothetical protein JWM21_4756 [Acidobacteria bacterium]|nr:hypothetical protein [Acidobacteriota bacterium]